MRAYSLLANRIALRAALADFNSLTILRRGVPNGWRDSLFKPKERPKAKLCIFGIVEPRLAFARFRENLLAL